ncbi:MAG: ABC transporter substrate-binding protein [Acidobacteriota bacterium]
MACTTSRPPESVRIAVPFEVTTLDPHAEDKLSNSAVVFNNIYEPLVSFDAEMKIRPALAESWENPEATAWTFHLRRGAVFHSGHQLTAADVVHSFRRLLDSPTLQIRGYVATVVEVRALSEHDVLIKTRVQSPVFLSKLAQVMIVREGSTVDSLRGAADGTGPYAVSGWTPGQLLRLRKHDRYWGAVDGAIGEAEFVLAQTPAEAISGLLGGRDHVIRCDSKEIERTVGSSERYEILRRDNLYVKYLAFDLARGITPYCSRAPNPFLDRRVREAVDLAINRPRLVREIQSYGVPATQPVPRPVLGFNPAILDRGYHPDEARALLESAGVGSGFKVTLHARKIVADAAKAVQEDLARVGIEVEVVTLADLDFFDLMNRRGATFWLNRFGCATGDASDFLDSFVHSPAATHGFGTLNYAGFSDAALDRAIEDSAMTDSAETRRDLLQDLLGRIMEERIVVPLYDDQDVYAVDRRFTWRPRADSGIRIADIGLR